MTTSTSPPPVHTLDAHPWARWTLAAAMLAFAVAFTLLGISVLHGAMADTDRAVRDWIVTQRPAWSVALASFISTVGETQWTTTYAVILCWVLLRRVGWWLPLLIACALVSSEFVDWLKEWFGVTRPPTGERVRTSLSFPSGHANGSAAVALFTAWVIARERPALAGVATSVGISVAALVGLSRMFVDVHWLSDVIGGWVIGAAMATAFCVVWEAVRRRNGVAHVTRRGPS